jgi:hypothetical protein
VLVQTNMLDNLGTERSWSVATSRSFRSFCRSPSCKNPAARGNTLLGFQLGLVLSLLELTRNSRNPGPPPSLGYTDLFTEWTDRAAVIALSAGRNRRITAPKSAIPVRQREAFAREIFRRTINWTLGNDICQPEFRRSVAKAS